MNEKYESSVKKPNTWESTEGIVLKAFNENENKENKSKINKSFDNFFSSDKLQEKLNDKTKNKDTKLNELRTLLLKEFGKEFNQSIRENDLGDYISDFFSYLKSNTKALNIVIENGLFNIMDTKSCPDDTYINELKNIYKKNHIENITKTLTKLGINKTYIDNLFTTNICEPVNLIEKLKGIKDKNGNKLSDEQIKDILKGVIHVKEINTEQELIEKNFFKNSKQRDTYLEYMVNMKFYFKKITKKEEQLNFIRQTLTKLGVNKIEKSKLESLLKYTKTYIKLKENEDLKNVNNYLDKIRNKGKNEKKEEIKDFSGQLPKEYTDSYFGGFYETAFKEEKFAGKYILDKITEKLEIKKDNFSYKIINELLTSVDLNKKSTASIADIIIKYLSDIENRLFISNKIKKIIKKLRKLSNNARELDFFFKKGYLTNTETIWLYNEDPNKLKKYNIDNLSKAPHTSGHNQITTRIIFVKKLKEENLNDINSHGLIDYLLKTKIKTGNWDDAIKYIYNELGDKKFKEIVKHIKKNENGIFSNFIKDKQEIFNTLVNFSNFNNKDKIEQDMKLISGKYNIATAKTIKKIKKNGTIGTKDQDINFIKGVISSSDKTNITGIASNILNQYATTNPDKIRKIATELKNGNKEEKKLGNILLGMAGLANNLGLKITDIPPEAMNKLNEEIFIAPEKAVSTFVDALLKSGKIKDKDYHTTYKNILKYFKDQIGNDKKNIEKIFNKLDKIKNGEISKNDVNTINTLIKSLGNIGQRIFKTSIQNSSLPEDIKIKLLNGNLDIETLKIVKVAEAVARGAGAGAGVGVGVGVGVEVGETVNAFNTIINKTESTENNIQDFINKLGIDPKYFKNFNDFFTSKNVKDKNFDAFITYLKDNKIPYPYDNTKNLKKNYNELIKKIKKNKQEIAKSQKNLVDKGFYTKDEQKEIYQNIYYNTYLDDNTKKQFKESLEKNGIKLDEEKNTTHSNSRYIENLDTSEVGTKEILDQKNIFLDYKKKDGLVQIKNPFYSKNDIENQETIKAPNIKEGNTQLLLKYIQKSGFFKADELSLGKDSMKILEQFDLDIEKELTLENIKEFSKRFISGIFFLLKDKQVSSIQKQYIEKYENSFMLNPEDIYLHENIFTFLNDNSDLLSNIGLYDFTEEKLNLENIPSMNNKKYIDYTKKYNLG